MTKDKKNDGQNELFDLDRFDTAILRLLSEDGRMSLTELARKVGLTKTPVQARVKRLEGAGVIAGYRAVLNPIRMGLAHVAYVEVRLSDTREAALQAFNKAVRGMPEIEECHMMAAGFDYLMKVRTSDIADYRRVLGERISTLPFVASTSTYVAMEAVKEAGL
ncbi:MAG: Lrp/AsnC ligand binding domain-containing protein [Rhodobacteraceae bacterium]|nr:Lrp/AsnC ligand binding domain-containing protein [Paracoccaceae bacterium]